MEEIRLLLDYVILPLVCWIFYIDRKVVKLESESVKNADLEKIYNELKEIRKEITQNTVTKEICSFRHS